MQSVIPRPSQYLYLLVKVRTLEAAYAKADEIKESQYLYLLVKVRTCGAYTTTVHLRDVVAIPIPSGEGQNRR